MFQAINHENKSFLKTALLVATPIMIQNLLSALVGTADTMMLRYVSAAALSASSLANSLMTVLFCTFYGLMTGASVLAAQYHGRGDTQTVERVLGLAIRCAVLISLVFFIAAFAFPRAIMALLTSDAEVVRAGVSYLRVLSFSFLFLGVSQIYTSVLRAVGKAFVPTVTYVASLVTNVFFNACFIFGLCGLPALGLPGVALGTVIARAVEVLICMLYAFGGGLRIRLKALFGSAGVLSRDFARICTPSMVNDVVWSLASAVYASILGHLNSPDVVAANAAVMILLNLGAIACRGFANGTTILVGQALGAGDRKRARRAASGMLRLTIGFALLGGALMLALRSLLLSYYGPVLTSEGAQMLGGMVAFRAIQLLGEGINTCLICGCFRGGGDARYGMVLDSVFMWLVSLPLTALCAFVLKLPPLRVYFVMCMDEFEKMPCVFHHYRSGLWMRNITRSAEELQK